MYNETGNWECKTESDCFECPYPDCIKTQGYLKKIDRAKPRKRGRVAPNGRNEK